MARLTFPDQQQDLQNAAGFSLASECDGSVKFAKLLRKPILRRFGCRAGVWGGWSVSEVRAAFVTTPASHATLIENQRYRFTVSPCCLGFVL